MKSSSCEVNIMSRSVDRSETYAFLLPILSRPANTVVGRCSRSSQCAWRQSAGLAVRSRSRKSAVCGSGCVRREMPRAEALTHSPMSLELADSTRVSLRFSLAAVTELGNQINELIEAFKRIAANAADGKRTRERSLEYRHADDKLVLEIECNPNIYPNAFNALVYIRIDDGTIKLTSQALLTKLVDNVKSYKAAMSA